MWMQFFSGIDTQTRGERFLKSWDIDDLFDPNLCFRYDQSDHYRNFRIRLKTKLSIERQTRGSHPVYLTKLPKPFTAEKLMNLIVKVLNASDNSSAC